MPGMHSRLVAITLFSEPVDLRAAVLIKLFNAFQHVKWPCKQSGWRGAGGGTFTGDATYYYDGTIGACSMNTKPSGFRTVAVNSQQWNGGALCGTCVQGSYTEGSGTCGSPACSTPTHLLSCTHRCMHVERINVHPYTPYRTFRMPPAAEACVWIMHNC
jgi:hypothetical protein